MSLVLRLLSPTYRKAVAAEAAGNYLEAARAYALLGQREKVGEMHILEAERLGRAGKDARLRELRASLNWLDDKTPSGRAILGRAAKGYQALLSHLPSIDVELCREAAQVALRGGDPVLAGELYEQAGARDEAIAAYEKAGELERMEALLQKTAGADTALWAEQDALAESEARLLLGQRDEALAALLRCKEAGAKGLRTREKQVLSLQGKLLTKSTVLLYRDRGAHKVLHVGMEDLEGHRIVLGRGGDCTLSFLDPGISRAHAQITWAQGNPQGGAYLVTDLDSKNGTTLSGLRISGELPLIDSGTIGMGDHVSLRYQVEDEVLTLQVEKGQGRGLCLVAAPAKRNLAPGVDLGFSKGRPILSAQAPIILNGTRARTEVQLIRGDVAEACGQRFEVPA